MQVSVCLFCTQSLMLLTVLNKHFSLKLYMPSKPALISCLSAHLDSGSALYLQKHKFCQGTSKTSGNALDYLLTTYISCTTTCIKRPDESLVERPCCIVVMFVHKLRTLSLLAAIAGTTLKRTGDATTSTAVAARHLSTHDIKDRSWL